MSNATLGEKVRREILAACQCANCKIGGPRGAAARLGLKRTTLVVQSALLSGRKTALVARGPTYNFQCVALRLRAVKPMSGVPGVELGREKKLLILAIVPSSGRSRRNSSCTESQAGRLLQRPFRGLHSVHLVTAYRFAESPSRPSAPEASAASSPPLLLRLLPGGANQFPGGIFTHCGSAPVHGALRKAG